MNHQNTLIKKDYLSIFFFAFFCRVLWAFFSGLHPQDGVDFHRWDALSSNIIHGNLNLETTVVDDPTLDTRLFIASPLFPYFFAGVKILSFSRWPFLLSSIQILLSSLGVVFLAATAELIFRRRSIALTSAFLYSISLPTLYHTHLAAQESLFQSLFVISFYWLCRYNSSMDLFSLMIFSLVFSLALLTKSHVILMLPFLVALILFRIQAIKEKFVHTLLLILTIGLLTLPYGLYNLEFNGTYIVSSSGYGGHFLTGHNEDFYQWLVHTPPKGSQEFKRLADLRFSAFTKSDFPVNASHRERQAAYLGRAYDWIKSNPTKATELFFYNLWNHLQPGYSLRFHSFKGWLVALVFNLPVYTFAYVELFRGMRAPIRHLPAYIVFVSMILFAVLFYSQNRFRLITVEPIYILYSSPAFLAFGQWFIGLLTKPTSRTLH